MPLKPCTFFRDTYTCGEILREYIEIMKIQATGCLGGWGSGLGRLHGTGLDPHQSET